MKKINKRKLRDEMICLGLTVLGIILFFLNITKTAPGMEGTFETIITTVIAYGFFIGPVVAFLGIGSFLEVRNKKYSRKRPH